MRETIFYGKQTIRGHDERLEDVDFSDAQFHFVAFRKLNLTDVRLPGGDGYIVVGNPRCVLTRAIAAMEDETDPEALGWRALFEHDLKWLGPDQRIGIFALADYETGQPGSSDRVLQMVRTADSACRDGQLRDANR